MPRPCFQEAQKQPRFTHTTRELATQLRISESTLRRLRKERVLKAGVHYRAVGMGLVRPALLWNPVETDVVLARRSKTELN